MNEASLIAVAVSSLVGLWGIRLTIADVQKRRAETQQVLYDTGREQRGEEREIDARHAEANAALVASITAGWQVIAQQQQATIAGLEARIATLERETEHREDRHRREIEERDNKIREYRTSLHAANNELAKAGLVQHLVKQGVFVELPDDDIATERRTPPPATPPVQVVVVEKEKRHE